MQTEPITLTVRWIFPVDQPPLGAAPSRSKVTASSPLTGPAGAPPTWIWATSQSCLVLSTRTRTWTCPTHSGNVLCRLTLPAGCASSSHTAGSKRPQKLLPQFTSAWPSVCAMARPWSAISRPAERVGISCSRRRSGLCFFTSCWVWASNVQKNLSNGHGTMAARPSRN